MGHDVFAYRNGKDKDEKVAYLRRSAFDDSRHVIYQALDAVDCDCGCSGCGNSREFSAEQIAEAIKRLPDGEESGREREFLEKCAEVGEPVLISFC